MPSVGKWLSRDPIGENGGENLYAGMKNASANYFDLLGLKMVFVGKPMEYEHPGRYIVIAGEAGIVFSITWVYSGSDCCEPPKKRDESYGPIYYYNSRSDSYYPLWNKKNVDNQDITGGGFGADGNGIAYEGASDDRGSMTIVMSWSADTSGGKTARLTPEGNLNYAMHGATWNIAAHYPWTKTPFLPFDDKGNVSPGEKRSGKSTVVAIWNFCDGQNIFTITGSTEDGAPLDSIENTRR